MSKFNTLSNPDQDLTNGQINIRGKTLRALNLLPGLPLKSDAEQVLFSQKLSEDDLDFDVITTPYTGTIVATDFETEDYFENQSLQTIETFQPSTQLPDETNISGLVRATDVETGNVRCNSAQDLTGSSLVVLDSNAATVSALTVELAASNTLSLTCAGQTSLQSAGNITVQSPAMLVPTISATSLPNACATKQYVDDTAGGGGGDFVSKTDLNPQQMDGALASLISLEGKGLISSNVSATQQTTSYIKSVANNSAGTPAAYTFRNINGLAFGLYRGDETSLDAIWGFQDPNNDGGEMVVSNRLIVPAIDASSSALAAANKSYVDSVASGGVAGPSTSSDSAVCLFDGTTGSLIKESGLTVSADNRLQNVSDPFAATDAATKQYVDGVGRTVFKGSAGATQTVYEDDKVRFIWDGGNKQPKYLVKVPPTGSWVDGGIQLTHEPLSQEFITEVDDLSIAISTEFYFTTSGSRNAAFDMSNYGNLAITWLCGEDDPTFPTYYIKWLTGNVSTSLTVSVEKY